LNDRPLVLASLFYSVLACLGWHHQHRLVGTHNWALGAQAESRSYNRVLRPSRRAFLFVASKLAPYQLGCLDGPQVPIKRNCLITLSWDLLYNGGNSSTNTQRTQTYVGLFLHSTQIQTYLGAFSFCQNPACLIHSRFTAIFAIFNLNRIYAASPSTTGRVGLCSRRIGPQSILPRLKQRYFQCHIRVGLGGKTTQKTATERARTSASGGPLLRGLNIEYIESGPFRRVQLEVVSVTHN